MSAPSAASSHPLSDKHFVDEGVYCETALEQDSVQTDASPAPGRQHDQIADRLCCRGQTSQSVLLWCTRGDPSLKLAVQNPQRVNRSSLQTVCHTSWNPKPSTNAVRVDGNVFCRSPCLRHHIQMSLKLWFQQCSTVTAGNSLLIAIAIAFSLQGAIHLH